MECVSCTLADTSTRLHHQWFDVMHIASAVVSDLLVVDILDEWLDSRFVRQLTECLNDLDLGMSGRISPAFIKPDVPSRVRPSVSRCR